MRANGGLCCCFFVLIEFECFDKRATHFVLKLRAWGKLDVCVCIQKGANTLTANSTLVFFFHSIWSQLTWSHVHIWLRSIEKVIFYLQGTFLIGCTYPVVGRRLFLAWHQHELRLYRSMAYYLSLDYWHSLTSSEIVSLLLWLVTNYHRKTKITQTHTHTPQKHTKNLCIIARS